ncbi:diguanylate cyclase [Rhodoferax sp.]|uniref:diguanylate cyclase n=1 Tax=Rhodoferax sp. TaxID=50421 RepID=UPI0027627186|nr:diguanylate cyclase [Rhodoferax sp.]
MQIRHSLTSMVRHGAIWFALAMLAPPCWAGESADLERLDGIYRTALKDNAQALREAQAFASQITPDTPYSVRVEFLRTRIPLLQEIGQVSATNADIAELLRLGQQQKDMAVIAQATVWAAAQKTEADQPDEALPLLLEAKALAEQSANPVALLALNRAFGNVYSKLGNLEKALDHYLAAVRLADQQPRRRAKAKLDQLSNLSTLYVAMKEPAKALATLDEALKLAPEAGSQAALASLKINRGIALVDLGQHDKALAVNQEALAISRKAGLVETEIVILINLADHHLRAHRYEKAESFARQALQRAEQTGSKANAAVARANLGFALAGQGKIKEGVAHVQAVIAKYRESGSRADEEAVTAELADMYEKAGLYREATGALRQQLKLNRDIFQADQAKAISRLQEQFHAEQRQKQIELLARENKLKDTELINRQLQQSVTLLGTAVTFMSAGFVLWLYRRVRQTNRRLKEANSQLEFHSVRDPLTGLYNRRSFLDLMKRRPSQIEGGRRETAADNQDGLMILDIDHFKPINDTWGHATGDAVLVEVAQRLRSTVRESDMVLRWGGEEFLVYSPRANPQHLKGLAERLLEAIGSKPIVVGGQSIPVTVTAGFIALPYSGISEALCNWEKALQIADMALYMGKVNGRNRAYGVGPLRVAPEIALPILDHDLSAALKAGMIELTEVMGPAQTANPGH